MVSQECVLMFECLLHFHRSDEPRLFSMVFKGQPEVFNVYLFPARDYIEIRGIVSGRLTHSSPSLSLSLSIQISIHTRFCIDIYGII